MFKGLTGLGSLLKQAQEISGRMKGLNEQLRARRATGSAGGGMVEVEVNGLLEVLGCHIDQQRSKEKHPGTTGKQQGQGRVVPGVQPGDQRPGINGVAPGPGELQQAEYRHKCCRQEGSLG